MSATHDHDHGMRRWEKAFGIGIALNVIFVAVEVFYGLAANSSALLADAGHNASDVLSLVFAWAAIWIAGKKPSGKYTYGLRRTTILASIVNALLIVAAAGVISWDAIRKIQQPAEVAGMTIVLVAGIGVVINTITALMFMKGQKDDLNIKGAFLHMAADAGVSLGVVIAGLLIRYTGANWIDPLISLVIVSVILYGTWGLLRDSVNLALDAVPKDIDLGEVQQFLRSREEVQSVHDLHVWGMSTTEVALTAHLVVSARNDDHFLSSVRSELHQRFGIAHTTLQLESSDDENDCENSCTT
ncbi:MAG: cation diffusion facilitator family transporter [candidate division Zixibacteria bacterium]|jgi:cobalt-zinc-cadmium efflux system protein|nr:cation diffusion facilitator family transporter [candidate division Zixibacteria bacterium]